MPIDQKDRATGFDLSYAPAYLNRQRTAGKRFGLVEQ